MSEPGNCKGCGNYFAKWSEYSRHACDSNSKFVRQPSNFGTGTTMQPREGAFVNRVGKPVGRSRPAVKPATEKQVYWLKKLSSELYPGTEDYVDTLIAQGFDRVSKALSKLFAERDAKIAANTPFSAQEEQEQRIEAATAAASTQQEFERLYDASRNAVLAGDTQGALAAYGQAQRAEQAVSGPKERPKSRPNQYAGVCGNCGKRVAELEGVREWIATAPYRTRTGETRDGKWVVWHREGECPSSNTFPFPDGRYAVENEEGLLRFYVCRDGKVFVMASDELHRIPDTAAKAIIAKIAEDPIEASKRFGRELGSCGICGRTLTNENSREEGIGPICARKAGW